MSEIKQKSPAEQRAISKYMSELGHKGGLKNKNKGSAYFKWVRSHGKKKGQNEQSSSPE